MAPSTLDPCPLTRASFFLPPGAPLPRSIMESITFLGIFTLSGSAGHKNSSGRVRDSRRMAGQGNVISTVISKDHLGGMRRNRRYMLVGRWGFHLRDRFVAKTQPQIVRGTSNNPSRLGGGGFTYLLIHSYIDHLCSLLFTLHRPTHELSLKKNEQIFLFSPMLQWNRKF